jgi:FMN-dependent NADH-azoreductase
LENKIHKAIIIETKGGVFAEKFKDKRHFMEQEFIRQNNEKYGYKRFDFLYLEDTVSAETRISKTINAINNFFS